MTAVRLDNPYWRIVEKFPNSGLRWSKGRFEPESYPIISDLMEAHRKGTPLPDLANFDENKSPTRSSLVKQFAWAIPSDQTLAWIRKRLLGREVVEIGAGRGYWAWMLEQVGIPVTAYDEKLLGLGEEIGYFKDAGEHTYHEILRGGPEKAALHPDKVLFLCWPPYDDDMAVNCLRAYQGDTLMFEGEGEGGCTANDAFFTELAVNWVEVDQHYPTQWSGIHDFLTIYRRSERQIDLTIIREEP